MWNYGGWIKISIRTSEKDIGKIYGCYKIIDIAEDRKSPSGQIKKYYKCKCMNCNNIVELNAYKVRNNDYQYCPKCKPVQKSVPSLIGMRFGKLKVIERTENHVQPSGATKVVWKCQCDCGNIVNVQDNHLKTGHTSSCGCYHAERMKELLVRDLTEIKFGKLTPIRKTRTKKRKTILEM